MCAKSLPRLLSMVLLFASCVSLVLGCARPAEQNAASEKAPTGPPAKPVVNDNAASLLFTFMGKDGQPKSVSHVADVPKEMRSRVLVVDLSKTPKERQAHRYAFFSDLTTKRPDGNYDVTVVSRYNGAKGGAVLPLAPLPKGAVVVYSATWCMYCKKAKRFLKEQGVPFIDRDVEKTPGAQQELNEKMRKAQVVGGGIPVIDVGGTLVVGFDKPKIKRALVALRSASTPP